MTRRRTGGVVLLEAVIAVVVIASVASACVSLRSRAIRQRLDVERALATDGALEALLAEALAGLLDAPAIETLDSGAVRSVWRGERFDEPYEVGVEIVEIPNPLAERDADAPRTIAMRRWSVVYGGGRIEELRLPTP